MGKCVLIGIKLEIHDTKDPKWDKALKELKKANGSYVTVGIHEGAGSYSDGEDVVNVALWNEFGTDTIPERSFFRSAIDGNEDKINAWREEALVNIIENGWTSEKALEMIGFRIQVLVQNKIQSDVPPPNAKSTTDEKVRKGVAPRTLLDTRLMLRSVTYKVVTK